MLLFAEHGRFFSTCCGWAKTWNAMRVEIVRQD